MNSDLDLGEDKDKEDKDEEGKDEEGKDKGGKDEEGKDEDEDEEPVGTGHEDSSILLPLPPLPIRFTSVWKATIYSKKETLPGIKSAIYNTNNLYLFQLEEWRE